MMRSSVFAVSLLASVMVCAFALGVAACETEDATTASIRNDYPVVADGGDRATQTVVYRGWFTSTLFLDPVAPGATSGSQRTVPAVDYVYAVLAVDWDPGSGTTPTKLVPIRSKGQLSVKRGDLGLITVSTATFDGDCNGGTALSQDDADFVTQRIFPGTFSGVMYDAASCKSTPVGDGGGADGGALDGGVD